MDQLLALRVFVRIAESGTFSKAADSLNVPRATATKLVQDLESHLGTKLLQRTTRRVNVTPEGAAYYERAVRLIGDLGDMDSSVRNARAQPRGRLRVDIGSSLANLFLLPMLPGFLARYPEIQLDLGVSDRQVDLIGEGVDCVIRGGALADTSQVARRIANLAFVTCASPVYLGARGAPKHPSDLTPQPESETNAQQVPGHVIAGYFSAQTGKALPLLFRRGEETIEIQGQTSVAVNESTAHLSALLSGLGIGQTLRFMASPHLRSGALKPVLEKWTRPSMPLQIVYPSHRHLNAKVRVFVDWVVEAFASFDDGDDSTGRRRADAVPRK